MTQQIILIRHAKSDWADFELPDHDRKLNARGRKTAPAMGRWLSDLGYVPDLMLVSDAARTVETAQLIRAELPSDPKVQFMPSLYHASPDTLLNALQTAQGTRIALIGHNPGIAMLAEGLVKSPPPHSRFHDYPTCATTILEFEGELTLGAGRCIDFAVPKDVM